VREAEKLMMDRELDMEYTGIVSQFFISFIPASEMKTSNFDCVSNNYS
jgi:hypothetical protein